jgi:hypothetical protein
MPFGRRDLKECRSKNADHQDIACGDLFLKSFIEIDRRSLTWVKHDRHRLTSPSFNRIAASALNLARETSIISSCPAPCGNTERSRWSQLAANHPFVHRRACRVMFHWFHQQHSNQLGYARDILFNVDQCLDHRGVRSKLLAAFEYRPLKATASVRFAARSESWSA